MPVIRAPLHYREAGVVGHPVAHSISPVIFDTLSRMHKTPLRYSRFDCDQRSLPNFIARIKKESFIGCNVTIPHKQSVLKSLDLYSPEVKAIGSVNVIRRQGARLKGFNTDVFGIEQTFISHKISPKKKSAVIFGAGGAARAVAYYLAAAGAKEIGIMNRNGERAKQLVREYSKQFSKTQFNVIRGEVPCAQIYVQATPVGMLGFSKSSPLRKLKSLQRGAFAFDLVYRPEHTAFLEDAKRLGMKTAGGLDMLIWQGMRTWEIWLGRIENPKRTHSALKRVLRREMK